MDGDLFGAFDEVAPVADVQPAAASEPLPKRRKGEGDSATAGEGSADAPSDAAARDDRRASKSGQAADNAEGIRFANVVTSDTSTAIINGRKVTKFSAIPEGYEKPAPPDPPLPPAKEYPFTLDPFQQAAVGYIEDNESVLVSAHTSAGKTVMAEYAIAKSLRENQRVVYTSPIKALSNQKFRDMQQEFGDVGLMTGDIQINPDARVLIMTTEILRSMLYRGSEIMREVAWVIYDEVHYMRDRERGIVWEESIILLPHTVRFVFLSATIPNAQQFVTWVAMLHRQPCHVVYTDYRPTPLEHYLFPAGSDGLHLVVDNQARFRDQNFNRAMNELANGTEEEREAKLSAKRQKKQMAGRDLLKILKLIAERGYDPVIVFSFAKKQVEGNARQMARDLDLNSDEEKKLIAQVYENAIQSLSADDQRLPQVEGLLPLLQQGLGVHHGGMLPLLKEVVEVLFAEGLIKCLFATETFSIGLNMPAKTVVFTNSRKFDGMDFRWVTPGEYIQMSGRAGRRGLDSRGIVIQMLDEKMEPSICKNMVYGSADPLNSSFRISYNMLLNMMRVEGASPTHLMRCSFFQFQQEQRLPALKAKLEDAQQRRDAIVVAQGDDVAAYCQMTAELEAVEDDIARLCSAEEHARPFITRGRLARAVVPGSPRKDFGIAILLSLHTTPAKGAGGEREVHAKAIVQVGAEGDAAGHGGSLEQYTPHLASDTGGGPHIREVQLPLAHVRDLSLVCLQLKVDVASKGGRRKAMRMAQEVTKRMEESQGGIPLLDAVEDLDVDAEAHAKLAGRRADLTRRIAANAVAALGEQERAERVALFEQRRACEREAKDAKRELRSARSLIMMDDLRRMSRVLRRLGHADAGDVIQLKGRVACEINSSDELVATELMFNGAFAELSDAQLAALLSCLCYNEKKDDDAGEGPEDPDLAGPFQQLQEAARHVGQVMSDCKVDVDVENFVEQFNPGMMEVLYRWAGGAKFVDICKMTDEYEGSVIRLIRREEELLRQLSSASYAIGNMELRDKFDSVSAAIKRDVVFCPSLYL